MNIEELDNPNGGVASPSYVRETEEVCSVVHEILIAQGKTLSTAESCTSGRIAAEITSVSGSSAYFQGGLIAYQNEVKIKMLGVKAEIIDTYDVVSEEVARYMVRGACRLFGTDYAIASTGYAGPSGGTESIPVGTIWIACGSVDNMKTKCLTGDLGRVQNVERATKEALKLMLDFLLKESVRNDPAKDYYLA
ncbi:MAG: CinA family protein [Bacteroidaceae bacterium]|nr:CinA family protein [Bacteroidaceae bacterium]MBR3530439.1 CinA family protein [Bacteroidaceae bacterium]